MARDTDGIIQDKFAENGDVSLGDLVIKDGWPLSYSTPGGKNPQRLQFNQLYKNLFALAKEINQKGPFLEYDATIDYAINAVITATDSNQYRALAANGPATSVVSPIGNPATWVAIFDAITTLFDDSGVGYTAANVQIALQEVIKRANQTGTQALTTITGHDKAAHDALDIDAETLGGAAYETSNKSADGSFTSGAFRFTRIGNLVSISFGNLGHASTSAPSTLDGFLPASFRPSDQVTAAYLAGADLRTVSVTASGQIILGYRDTDGVLANNVNSGTGTISYSI